MLIGWQNEWMCIHGRMADAKNNKKGNTWAPVISLLSIQTVLKSVEFLLGNNFSLLNGSIKSPFTTIKCMFWLYACVYIYVYVNLEISFFNYGYKNFINIILKEWNKFLNTIFKKLVCPNSIWQISLLLGFCVGKIMYYCLSNCKLYLMYLHV